MLALPLAAPRRGAALAGTASCAALAAVLLGGCASPPQTSASAPPSTSASAPPSTGQASPTSASPSEHVPIHPVDYYRDHPDEAPQSIRGATVVVDEKLTGTHNVKKIFLGGSKTGGYKTLTIFLTCAGDVSYEVVPGTVEQPDGDGSSQGGYCGGGNLNPLVVDAPEGNTTVQFATTMTKDTTYYLTVYGQEVGS